jgi:hypothetical protein
MITLLSEGENQICRTDEQSDTLYIWRMMAQHLLCLCCKVEAVARATRNPEEIPMDEVTFMLEKRLEVALS